jgi:hypothetical protein
MLKKGNMLYSILFLKCPRCHEAPLFQNPSAYKLSEMATMHKNCPHCQLKYETETGFFVGAMYVSYSLTVAFGVAFFVAYYVFSILFDFEFNAIHYLILISSFLILFAPVMFRLSRSIWMNLFIKYNPKEKGPKLKDN